MAPQPSKPSRVDVKQLQSVVTDLTALQNLVQDPPPGSFTAIGQEIKSNLGSQTSDNGLVDIAGIDDVDKRYQDAVTTTNQAWPDVTSGISALIGMLNDTINKHMTADHHAADGANDTNTSTTGGTGTTGRGGH
ncbi:hypothetical protein [uncultured Jatrophihabitans sp.]|uniref:hypothetical protein n=1 Tax=uncultured Jatrophihabitans sp. TaxID=1610747 RepID=UPI0035CBBC31